MMAFQVVYERLFDSYYVKLQDAFASEANVVGGWQMIGYVAPGAANSGDVGTTSNFEYTNSGATDKAATVAIDSFDQIEWGAANIVALNACKAQDKGAAAASANWTVKVIGASNGNSLSYEFKVNDDDCKPLTASFESMGK